MCLHQPFGKGRLSPSSGFPNCLHDSHSNSQETPAKTTFLIRLFLGLISVPRSRRQFLHKLSWSELKVEAKWTERKSKSYDQRSVGQCVLVAVTHLGPVYIIILSYGFVYIWKGEALSGERTVFYNYCWALPAAEVEVEVKLRLFVSWPAYLVSGTHLWPMTRFFIYTYFHLAVVGCPL
jgi:hypothetical protein